MAPMSVNLSKSRNLVFKKGKVLNENVLSIKVKRSKCFVPPISEKPVKFLGRTMSDSLSDKHQVDNLSLSVRKGLVCL